MVQEIPPAVVPLLFAVITGAIAQTHSLLIPCSEGNPARSDRLLPEPLLRDDSVLIACSEAIADRSRVPVTVLERPPVDIGRRLIFWRYYRMMKRIKKDPAAKSYSDEAMRLPSASDETDKIVELFADKIPHTHGAPVRATVGRQAM